MFNRLARSVAATLSAVLVSVGLTVFGSATPANALTGKMFDPGLIISDSVFFDFGTMTVEDIQRFLDSKVPVCNANDGGPTCLRYYKMNTPAKPAEVGRCTALEAKVDQTAAQVIYDIAHACGINPRALIVILQKEQGLIQASNPTAYMYKAAFGYGCPDSDPAICGKVWVGLFNQMHRAAGQLQWYGDPKGSFTYLKPGKNISIGYHPNSACGKKTFALKSQATANLYYYTPYTPNAAALAKLYGTGDSCSAYGNRNFWRFYSDWFGSPIGGGFLLKSATSGTYLIVDETRYLINEPELLTSLAPLGPLGVISDDYLNSFKDGGALSRLVKSATGTLFLVDGGKRYTVNSCDIATSISLDCAAAVTLSSSQLSALPSGGTASALVTDEEANRYLIKDGVKQQILDDVSITAASLNLPALSRVNISAFADLPWGAPIAADGSIFTNSTTGKQGVLVGGKYFELDPETASELPLSQWFSVSTGKLTSAGLSTVYTNTVVKPIVADPTGQHWLLTANGKRALTNGTEFVTAAPAVNSEFLNRVPTSAVAITAPALVKGTTSGTYLITATLKRTPATGTDLNLIKTTLGTDVTQIPETALKQITTGTPVYAPGSLLRAAKSRIYYLADGYSRLIEFADIPAKDALALPAIPRKATDATLATYKVIKKYSGLKVTCEGKVYLPVKGMLFELDSAAATKAWPGNSTPLTVSTCKTLGFESAKIGRLIRTSSGIYYISGGKRQLVKGTPLYRALAATTTPYVWVDDSLAKRLPIGSPAKMPIATPTPTPTATPSVTPTTAAPTATPSPTTNAKTYKVVSGDTLGGIATKFKTTVAKLKALNKLTTDTIRIGQILAVP